MSIFPQYKCRRYFAQVQETPSPAQMSSRTRLGWCEDPRGTRLDAADHGFSALKSSGRVREDIWTEAVEVLLDWLPR